MTAKLRMLTIVSLAHRSKKVSYASLQSELGISNVRELEDLIIDTIYSGLLEGRLDQHKVHVRPLSGAPKRAKTPLPHELKEIARMLARLA